MTVLTAVLLSAVLSAVVAIAVTLSSNVGGQDWWRAGHHSDNDRSRRHWIGAGLR
ncbi:MAG: hypothetical protein CM15mP18_0770 [Methanobacteriota archaeon]|nr:MAG: hypothetical protein CM15mP18_0770 [Euryarchaeota archaeon]